MAEKEEAPSVKSSSPSFLSRLRRTTSNTQAAAAAADVASDVVEVINPLRQRPAKEGFLLKQGHTFTWFMWILIFYCRLRKYQLAETVVRVASLDAVLL